MAVCRSPSGQGSYASWQCPPDHKKHLPLSCKLTSYPYPEQGSCQAPDASHLGGPMLSLLTPNSSLASPAMARASLLTRSPSPGWAPLRITVFTRSCSREEGGGGSGVASCEVMHPCSMHMPPSHPLVCAVQTACTCPSAEQQHCHAIRSSTGAGPRQKWYTTHTCCSNWTQVRTRSCRGCMAWPDLHCDQQGQLQCSFPAQNTNTFVG